MQTIKNLSKIKNIKQTMNFSIEIWKLKEQNKILIYIGKSQWYTSRIIRHQNDVFNTTALNKHDNILN